MDDLTTRKQKADRRRLANFERRYGVGHYQLARHAALPVAFTPEMLYCIWANFVPSAPWIAVADLILSLLCKEVGYELFEIETELRDLLLSGLGANQRHQLAEFLIRYADHEADTTDDVMVHELSKMQKWTGLAYTEPNRLVEQLQATLRSGDEDERWQVMSIQDILPREVRQRVQELITPRILDDEPPLVVPTPKLDTELITVCYDFFPNVYDRISASTTFEQLKEWLQAQPVPRDAEVSNLLSAYGIEWDIDVSLIASEWLWENLGKDLFPLEFSWAQAAERYAQWMYELNRTMHTLEAIYTDVYILNHQTVLQTYSLEELMTEFKQHRFHRPATERVNTLDLLRDKQGHRLYILGKPGSGKTTLMRYFVLIALQGKIKRTPIFVALREWGETDLSLEQFIAHQFDVCGFPDAVPFVEQLLKAENGALVLFDGLDEIRLEGDQRRRAIRAIQNFCLKYHQAQCIISCRIAASEYMFRGFTTVEIADFTDAQVERFIRKWFARHPVSIRDNFLYSFDQEQNKSLKELARTPLLLSLICVSFDSTMQFPANRIEMFDQAVDTLLADWDASRNVRRDSIHVISSGDRIKRLPLARKKQLFADIAFSAFIRGEYFLEVYALQGQIASFVASLAGEDVLDVDGGVFLDHLVAIHGILVPRTSRYYSFSHLTIQEYFTAVHIVNKANSSLETVIPHFCEQRWREVFLMVAQKLPNGRAFFDLVSQHLASLISADLILTDLFQTTEAKARLIQTSESIESTRLIYLFLNLTLALDGRSSSDSISFDRILVSIASSSVRKVLSRVSQRSIEPVEGVALDFSIMLDVALTNILLLAQNKQDSEITPPIFYDILAFVERGSDLSYQRALQRLPNPTDNWSKRKWQGFAAQVRQIMITHRQFGYQFQLSYEQTKRLEDYFYGVELLLDCLDLAYVRDKNAIRSRLFLI